MIYIVKHERKTFARSASLSYCNQKWTIYTLRVFSNISLSIIDNSFLTAWFFLM